MGFSSVKNLAGKRNAEKHNFTLIFLTDSQKANKTRDFKQNISNQEVCVSCNKQMTNIAIYFQHIR